MAATEKWGSSVEEAVEIALKEMKLTEDQVNVTVLEEPSKGFFGIGAKLAKVRVEEKEPEKTKETSDIDKDAKEVKAKEKKENRPSSAKKPKKKEKKPEATVEYRAAENIALDGIDRDSLQVVDEHEALTFLKDVTEKMGLKLDFETRAGENVVYIEMSGDDARTIIGKRGQTLDAVQYLTSLVVNKEKEEYMKVVLDAENYRSKRLKTLEQLANRLAGKVVRTGKYVRLEPMNPYERKVIHSTLQSHPDVVTRSEGEEPYRKVIIEKKK